MGSFTSQWIGRIHLLLLGAIAALSFGSVDAQLVIGVYETGQVVGAGEPPPDPPSASVDRYVRHSTCGVDPGSNSDDGSTEALAFATLSYAVQNSTQGDSIQVQACTEGGSTTWTGDELVVTVNNLTVGVRATDTVLFTGTSNADPLSPAIDASNAVQFTINGVGGTMAWYGGMSAAFDDGALGNYTSTLATFTDVSGSTSVAFKNIEIYNTWGSGKSGNGSWCGINSVPNVTDLRIENIVWDGHGILDDAGIDRGDAICISSGAVGTVIQGNTIRHAGHNTIEDFGTNTVVRGNTFNNCWGDASGYDASQGQRAFGDFTQSDQALIEDNVTTCGGGVSDLPPGPEVQLYTPLGKLTGNGVIYRNNVHVSTLTGPGIDATLRTINDENLNVWIYNNAFSQIGGSAMHQIIDLGPCVKPGGGDGCSSGTTDPNPGAGVKFVGNAMDKLREDPRDGTNSQHDSDIRFTWFDNEPASPWDYAHTYVEAWDNLFSNDTLTPVIFYRTNSSHREDLTDAETNIPGTVHDNDIGTVSFPDDTGDTLADFALTGSSHSGLCLIDGGSSGTTLTLDPGCSYAFWDGEGVDDETADQVSIITGCPGSCALVGTRTIVSTDDANDQIVVDSAITVSDDDQVHWTPALNGSSTASYQSVVP